MSLALLVAAFMCGCQDQGSGPVGPDGLTPAFGKGGNKPPKDPPTGPRIAVVGSSNKGPGGQPAAKQIAEVELGGTYNRLTAKRFNKMSPEELRENHDVLIFNWKSSASVNAKWNTRLLPYMHLGGGIIFEDPNNVADLAAGVSTIGVQNHSPEPNPITITIASELALTTVPNSFPSTATFINNHIIFDVDNSDAALMPFLALTRSTANWPNGVGKVVGLYGNFGSGRIVLTGPDNNFHGHKGGSVAERNHYNLLWNEIVWVMPRD